MSLIRVLPVPPFSYVADSTQFWVGASRASDSQFHWSTSGHVISSDYWHENEPNNVSGQEDCVSLEKWDRDGYNYRLNDTPCDVNKAFICQYLW